MYANRYLLAICIFIVVLMNIIKHVDIDSADLVSNAIEAEVVSDIKNPSIGEIDENIIMKDEEIINSVSKDSIKDNNPIVIKKPKPYITSEAYMVANIDSGEIYLSKNIDTKFPIASLTKLYTAIVASHQFKSDSEINISQDAIDTVGEAGHLVLDEKYTIGDLLYPLLLESSNDAAVAISENFGGSKFISQMNLFVSDTGMYNTHFEDSSGLSSQNKSTVSDLFILAKYLYKNEKKILDITKNKIYSLPKTDNHSEHKYVNINPYSNYDQFIGGKTGRTIWAKESMVSIFNHKISGVDTPVVVIVLRSELGEREIDTEKLLGKFIEIIDKK